MIPLVSKVEEFVFLKENTLKVAAAVMDAKKTKVPFLIGTMIEVPRCDHIPATSQCCGAHAP